MLSDSKLLHLRISAGYRGYPDVLRRLELTVETGEIVGLVDAIGMGKNMVPLAVMRLLDERGGSVRGYLGFRGKNLMELDARRMKAVRGREIALLPLVSQSPLNHYMRVGAQIMESWRQNCSGKGNDARPNLLELVRLVGAPPDSEFLERLPAELTTSELHRLRIAMAIVHKPALLIADEPTRGVDPITKLEILEVLTQVNRKLGMSILLLSRDLISTATICHRVAVLRNGEVVESDTPEAILGNPQHAYTKALLASAAKRPTQKGASAVA